MSLQSGTVSYLRFVAEPPPDAFEGPFCDALQQHGFRDIDPDTEVETARGWVLFDDAFGSDFDPRTLVSNSGHILVRMRIDTLKIPAVTLKAYTERDAQQRAQAQGRDKLTKRELDLVKLETKKRLRKRSLPKMQLVEAVWTIASGEVRLMATSKAVATAFVELFEKTFSLKLQPVGLRTVLWLRGIEAQRIEAVDALEPERFHLIRH
jgi:hypothetical protein